MNALKLLKSALLTAAAVLLWTASSTASAAHSPCTGINIGNASTEDVRLNGADSDACVISGVNPQQGPNGNTSGFHTEFGGGWSLLTKIASGGSISPNPSTINGVTFFTSGFTEDANNNSGTWSLSTDVSAKFDLVFALHASPYSGAFLFDNESLVANTTEQGTWVIEWNNKRGNVPDYSNLTLFVRDVETLKRPQGVLPEPATWLLVLSGLVAATTRMRRRKH